MAALSPDGMWVAVVSAPANRFGSGDNRCGGATERHRTKSIQPHRASLRPPWKQDTGSHEARNVRNSSGTCVVWWANDTIASRLFKIW